MTLISFNKAFITMFNQPFLWNPKTLLENGNHKEKFWWTTLALYTACQLPENTTVSCIDEKKNSIT